MTASTVFFLLFVLACPLMMMLMMRGGHGHGGHGGDAPGCHGGDKHEDTPAESTDDLRRRREELDRAIAEREATEEHELAPTGWGWDRR